MGRVGCLLIIVVVLVIAWDQYRIEQLRQEVRGLARKVHVQDGRKERADDLVTNLAAAERHTRRAKELIRAHKPAEAQAELDRALDCLTRAGGVSQDIVGDAAEFLGRARENAERVFRKAWQDVAKEAKQKK